MKGAQVESLCKILESVAWSSKDTKPSMLARGRHQTDLALRLSSFRAADSDPCGAWVLARLSDREGGINATGKEESHRSSIGPTKAQYQCT